eukprot:381855-Pelagomonas_calceolata.AAC.1
MHMYLFARAERQRGSRCLHCVCVAVLSCVCAGVVFCPWCVLHSGVLVYTCQHGHNSALVRHQGVYCDHSVYVVFVQLLLRMTCGDSLIVFTRVLLRMTGAGSFALSMPVRSGASRGSPPPPELQGGTVLPCHLPSVGFASTYTHTYAINSPFSRRKI